MNRQSNYNVIQYKDYINILDINTCTFMCTGKICVFLYRKNFVYYNVPTYVFAKLILGLFPPPLLLFPLSLPLPVGSLSNNSPIGKLRWFHTDPEPWKIFTGGYPELEGSGIRSLTLQTSQQTHLMTFKDPIIDFICLPSSPFSSGKRENSVIIERLCVCVCVLVSRFVSF